ncbi:RNHCP domain-containing protein [Candidatus Dojkabacteria bacterium]|nr:RNHCP domain-containing protein [Candidatus Dojkabacteria bacterium]
MAQARQSQYQKAEDGKPSRVTSFVCRNCGKKVPIDAPGTQNRNHCPFCLYSRHVDIGIGDRKSNCRGMMKPVGVYRKKDGELMIVHQCQSCGYVSKNRVAGDDNDELLKELEKKGVGDLLF